MTNVVALKSGGQIAGIIPQSFEDAYRIARCVSESGLAPKGMATIEQITIAIMTGLELGLPPMFAIQKIAVINGRPAIWGDAVPALLWSHGFKLREWVEGENETSVAHCELHRPDGETVSRSFSVQKAKKAGLWGRSGPWSQYPERMLQMRARGFACRDGAADVLNGIYVAEELQEPIKDITPSKAIALEVPDDIPQSVPAIESQDAEDTLADADGFIEKLSEDIALCQSIEDLNEVADNNADMIARLPKEQKRKAAKMLQEAAE